jgi:hypothetical protein
MLDVLLDLPIVALAVCIELDAIGGYVDERAEGVDGRRADIRDRVREQRRDGLGRAGQKRLPLERLEVFPQLTDAQAEPADEQG